jgi:preprotein translocase subunit SecE
MKYKEIIEKITGYLKDIRSEAKKVVWPGKDYVTAATIIVLLIVFLVSTFIMLVDFGFARFFTMFAKPMMR